MSSYQERTEYKYEVVPPFSIIQCRKADIVEKDGVEIARNFSRFSRFPGQDVSADPEQLQAIAAVLWTPEVIAAYAAHISINTQEFPPSENT